MNTLRGTISKHIMNWAMFEGTKLEEKYKDNFIKSAAAYIKKTYNVRQCQEFDEMSDEQFFNLMADIASKNNEISSFCAFIEKIGFGHMPEKDKC